MSDASVGEELRRLRRLAALSQRELAALADVPQPNIAAYESGRRQPSAETLARLRAALGIPSLERVRASRERILEVAARCRVDDVRVFGSVARGDATAGSDVDLLVHPAPGASIFDVAGFMAEVTELLGVHVDVVSDRGTGAVMDRIRTEAVAL
ncbi:XRE family transcriptional regulator [Clavibacter michiganensis]|uniref:Helix-turn-helix protein n=2 Tax=Clavibacter michiganensis subsp. michiganensis TaxID=33013 RepID=A0A1Y3FH23_CLAMM|nr:XRE family transcriptional regulator [Clavibacter michiganensis]MBE3079187.1 XRE family transcriptional regulator [Clavibacter michiganensis subsp. michiganensis]MBF4639067.1 XRE family transcriptional regulator [Clavibacter michiganensis subsp. michiganensis]MBW8027611.1 XRE family transcriptional regulator [Clavibacter michiganensis subsp. michiganensis]MDO4017929.1 helix-turn-helix domain-containing protein [Clavibacter michiganensis]MDO4025043.1 helix-turn-helix domain-containing protei